MKKKIVCGVMTKRENLVLALAIQNTITDAITISQVKKQIKAKGMG